MGIKIASALVLLVIAMLSVVGYRELPKETVAAAYVTPLDGRSYSQRHNARMAMRALDGAEIAPGAEFSFNKRVGSFSRDRGYRRAPVSFSGQLINDWGGGVCQVSTTLYNAALLAGLQITERNHHEFCPMYVAPGLDAAVAYSSVDLRFRNPYGFPLRIHTLTDENNLRVELISSQPLPEHPQVVQNILRRQQPATFYLGHPSHSARTRNSGRDGFEVAVYRLYRDRKELISMDEYPVMNRVVEYRG